MIYYSTIIKAVNTLLKTLYPKIHRYGNDTTDMAVTPYFFVEVVPTRQQHESLNMLRKSCNVYINYIQRTPDQIDNHEKYEAIFDTLGFTLDVQDPDHTDVTRHLTITGYTYTYTGTENHDLQIQFTVQWYESTQETPDELIEDVSTTLEADNG